jgi:hypothetical protein
MLALIGDRWLESDRSSGLSRLDDPSDYVRLELTLALKRHMPITPVLVGNVPMPRTSELPHELADLAFMNATRIDHGWAFEGQIARLMRDIEELSKDRSNSVNSLVNIVSKSKQTDKPFPIWKFVLMNRSGSSQVLTEVRCEVVEYRPSAAIPVTRVLKPIAVLDVPLPFMPSGKETFSVFPRDPILLANDDAVSIGLRFYCDRWLFALSVPGAVSFILKSAWALSTRKSALALSTGGEMYKMRFEFLTDQGLIAATDAFEI